MKNNAITVQQIGGGFYRATLDLGNRVNRGIGKTREEALERINQRPPSRDAQRMRARGGR